MVGEELKWGGDGVVVVVGVLNPDPNYWLAALAEYLYIYYW